MWARVRSSGFAKSAGILTVTMGFGDWACQAIERHFGLASATETDLWRVAAFAGTGAIGNAPLAYYGMKLGEIMCPGTALPALVRKVAFIAVFVEPFRMSSIVSGL